MTIEQISTLGLLLCLAPALVHGVEMVSPMLSRWVVRFVLPVFGPGVPGAASALTHDEQLTMLDAARNAGPGGKEKAAEDYVFLMLFEQRQGALAFLSVAVGIVYAIGLPLGARAPLHLVLGVMSLLFALVNANHAGIPFLGHHPRVSRHGKHVGIVFTLFWAVVTGLNAIAFLDAAS